MADSKISNLTAASALDGSEELAVVQSSTTKKVTVNSLNLEVIQFACSDETTALTTGTAKVTFRMPYAMTVTDVLIP